MLSIFEKRYWTSVQTMMPTPTSGRSSEREEYVTMMMEFTSGRGSNSSETEEYLEFFFLECGVAGEAASEEVE